MARWAFEDALEYATDREQFGQQIGDFQAVKHRLADMAISLTNARLLMYASLADDTLPSRIESSMAKVSIVEACQDVVDNALQIKGARGYLDNAPVAQLYRTVRGYSIAGGTSDIHRNMVARSLYDGGFPD
jgi:alkylation response protein AidB-like acyl-CoA dehydrogenase